MDEEREQEILKLEEDVDSFFPDVLIDHFLIKAGIQPNGNDVKKTIGLCAQKILTDIVKSADHHHSLYTKALQKDKIMGREKKKVLRVKDVENALEEMGVDMKRPEFFL